MLTWYLRHGESHRVLNWLCIVAQHSALLVKTFVPEEISNPLFNRPEKAFCKENLTQFWEKNFCSTEDSERC